MIKMSRVTTHTIPIQHGIGSPSQSSQAIQRNKRHPNCNGRKTVCLLTTSSSIQNMLDFTKNILELINKFSEVVEINTQKSVAFPYTNNKTSEK